MDQLICTPISHIHNWYRVVVVVVSHIQRIGCQPERTSLHGGDGGQSRSWFAEQGKNIKKKSGSAPLGTLKVSA